ncbi:MAG TPA: substrate-binding protein [Acidimicrobiia bacterium]|nr:substrate-binding protein [Acidimicrobiia bacterium]
MKRRSPILISLVLALVVTACGDGGGAGTTGAVTTGAETTATTAAPTTTSAETTSPPVVEEPIKIGIIADLTGPFTTYGNSLARSAQLAISTINAADGILGRQVEVIVEDIQTDVAATVDKARKLVQSDNVDLVMGPIGSDANDAAYAEVVEAGGKLLFYTETYEGGKCNELYFSFGAVPAQQIRPLIPILQEAYGTNAMLFGADYVWPRRSFEIAKPIIEENGGTVVSELYLPLIAEDFSELVQEVRDTQPDYIFSLYPAVWGAALTALSDAGLLDSVGIGTIFLGDPDYAGIADLAEGSYTALPFFTVADAPGVQPFLEAYAAEFGEGEIPSGGEGVGAYNAVWLYKQAVEQAGSTDPAAVAEAMVGQTYEGPTGTVEMMPSHHLKQTINLVQAQNGQYVLVDSFDDMDPEEDCSL